MGKTQTQFQRVFAIEVLMTMKNSVPTACSTTFVNYLFQRCLRDKKISAQLRRTDYLEINSSYWDTFFACNLKVDSIEEKLPFVFIAVAIACSLQKHNGFLHLGQAIASCFIGKWESEMARVKLRHLLACDETEDVCRVLRPLLIFIQCQVPQPLDYAVLLDELRWFHRAKTRVRARWAQQFYGKWVEGESYDSLC